MKRVGILLPAYNEGESIGEVLKEARKFFPDSTIVVVDDGSTDRTAEIAESEGATVIRHVQNLGKGDALKTGFEFFLDHTDVEYVIVADADGQYSVRDGEKLLRPLQDRKADFVMGARDWKKVPFSHRLGNLVWKTAFNLLFGTKLKDTNCGFIALNREALRRIEHTGGGYIVENSMLIEALSKNLRIVQVPVEVHYKHVSPFIRGIRMVLGILFFIIREGVKYRTRKLLKRFNPR